MQLVCQHSTVDFMHKVFEIFVLCDDDGQEYRTPSNSIAFETKRQLEGSASFRRFLAANDPDGARRADIRVEVDPYEDEGNGYTVCLLIAFKIPGMSC